MKKVILFLTLLTLLASGKQLDTKCFEYEADKFNFDKINYSGKKLESLDLQALKIYYLGNRDSTHPITVGYTIGGKERYNTALFCNNDGDTTWCGVECDGGGFHLKNDFSIRVESVDLYRDDPNVENGIEKKLSQKEKNIFIKGKEFVCPEKIPTIEVIDNRYYEDDPSGKYVCYDFKSDDKYEGCFRTSKSCRELHIQHFGKYLNSKESKKALKRCQDSTPNMDYVDNKNGLFVCYDYKSDGVYSGCFRSKKSCKRVRKEHFGKYPNILESKKALKRCTESTPREAK